MSGKGMNRRQFLHTSGLAAAGAAAVASGATLTASDGAWALQLGALTGHEGLALIQMCRQLYPHDALGDLYYAGVVEMLDTEAKTNGDLAGLLKEGVASLDSATGVAFAELSEGYQLEVLSAMETSPFFQTVRGKVVVGLYNNPLVWRHFGYEGASYDFGGYLYRGFDDVRWSGDPTEDASPKAE